ncbi:MAG: long-chain fatty acid--CoA ligase [Desulfobacterales bacterium]
MPKPWLQHYSERVPHTTTYPEHPVPRLLIDTAARCPEAIATTLYGTDITYGEINAKANGFAHGLKTLGVGKGDRVALLLPNSPTYVIAYYGILKLGAVVVNINVMTPGEELARFLNHTGAKVAVTLDLFAGNLWKVLKGTPVRHVLIHSVFGKEKELPPEESAMAPLMFNPFVAAQSMEEPAPAAAGADPAVLQFTGGTTGTPKAAVLTHRNIVANTIQIGSWHPTPEPHNRAVICILPFFHVFGMMTCLNLPVSKGYRMILIPMFDWSNILDTLELIRTYRPISFPAVPALWAVLVSHPRAGEYPLAAIEVAISGGAPLAPWVQEKFRDLTGRALSAAYGLTEASSTTHISPFHLAGRPGSIGVPIPDTDARIMDIETGERECPAGEIGELVVSGPQVMSGYWKDPESTVKAIRNGRLYTGDLARMDADGFFYIVDRRDDMVISGGYNIYPSDIEEVLERHPHVKEAAVIGTPDRMRGESVLAFVVPQEGAPADKPALLSYCREHLAAFKVPREIAFVEIIPRSPVGKPLRRVLRERAPESGAKRR